MNDDRQTKPGCTFAAVGCLVLVMPALLGVLLIKGLEWFAGP